MHVCHSAYVHYSESSVVKLVLLWMLLYVGSEVLQRGSVESKCALVVKSVLEVVVCWMLQCKCVCVWTVFIASPSDVCSTRLELRIQVVQLEDLHATVEDMVHRALDFPIGCPAADSSRGGKQHGGGSGHKELSQMEIVL